MTILRSGDEIDIVGGGPAGSLFALQLLHHARQADLDLRVTIHERRSFRVAGQAGCNRCAGILSSPLVRNLARLELTLPPEVVCSWIQSYCLHTPHGTIQVDQPHPSESILSVYRGAGPRDAPLPPEASFDGWLLGQAEERGARVRRGRVSKVERTADGPRLEIEGESRSSALLVLACGVNSPLLAQLGPPYRPPPTARMRQDEITFEGGGVRETLGDRVHVFLLPGRRLVFGTLVPKGDLVNVSLLSGEREGIGIAEFLDHEVVRSQLPGPPIRLCGCEPEISVGAARAPFAERLVIIGDAAVSRLYKDGIGAAFRTARAAALCAVRHGVSEAAFRRHYGTTCRRLARDNLYGKAIFALHRRIKDSRVFHAIQLRTMHEEATAPYSSRRLDRINWGMFTGTLQYRAIAATMLDPRLWWSISRAATNRWNGEPPRMLPAPAAPERPPAQRSPRRRILVLGGGFAGVRTAMLLERRFGRDPRFPITLVSDQNYYLFTPLLHEVATGGIETRHIATPIRRMIGSRRMAFRQVTIQSVDLDARRVHTTRGELPFDTLVLALGSITDRRGLSGASPAVLDLKTLGDSMLLRNRVIRMFEEVTSGKGDPSESLTFVVVGGGTNGVQMAAELNAFVRRSLPREYHRVRADAVRVVLIEYEPSLLPEMHPSLGDRARKILERDGVEVLTRTHVSDAGPGFICVEPGHVIHARTVVWTPGIIANPVVSSLPVQRDEIGRAKVTQQLEIEDHPGVFALGDNAHMLDPSTGQPLPPTAHIAIRQPRTAAHNVAAHLGGGPMRPFRYRHMGQMVSLGPRTALADLRGIHIHGVATRLLWQAAYASLIGGRYQQARVLTDWLFHKVFGRDSTLLRELD